MTGREMSDRGDGDFQQRVRTWHGFTRFTAAAVAAVVVILVGLAVTLV